MHDINKFCIFAVRNIPNMAREYDTNEPETQGVSEPSAEYGTAVKKSYRIISDEEIARCIPLEESRRRLTEKIYKFYHPEA